MKTAFLAAFATTLPLLAQAAEPQVAIQSAPEAAVQNAPEAVQEQSQPLKGAAPQSAQVAEQKVADPQLEAHRPWWKHRTPRPVGDRTVVRAPAKSAKPQPVQAREIPKTEPAPKAKPAPRAIPAPKAEPAPGEEEAPKRKAGIFGTFGRVFGGEKKEPIMSRSAVRRALPAPRSVTDEKPKPTPAPRSAAVAATKKAPASTPPAPEKSKPASDTPEVADVPAKKGSTKKSSGSSTPPAAAASAKPEVNEELALPGDSTLPQVAPAASAAATKLEPAVEFDRKNYLEIKQKAAQDPKIAELGKKLESASSGEAHKTAARRYTKALFKKMNELDSSQPDWYRRMEAATMRRIDAGKPIAAE